MSGFLFFLKKSVPKVGCKQLRGGGGGARRDSFPEVLYKFGHRNRASWDFISSYKKIKGFLAPPRHIGLSINSALARISSLL